MMAGDWIAVVAALAGVISAVAAWRSAGNAANSKVAAKQDADRAEQAVADLSRIAATLETQRMSDEGRQQAALEAPAQCERWINQIANFRVAQKAGVLQFHVSLSIVTYTEKLALNLLRERKHELHIIGFYEPPGSSEVRITARTQLGIERSSRAGWK